jgi:hypothetical protein
MFSYFERRRKRSRMPTISSGEQEPTQGIDYNVAMRRLVYMALLGSVVIFVYSLSLTGKFFAVVGVALMAAGGAILTGGLLGFLFGVPHTRDDDGTRNEQAPSPKGEQSEEGTRSPEPQYRHNTSLEQISDWLTKILVGVGLVEIKSIPDGVWRMASAIRKGLGDAEGADAFAAALLIFFFGCGFTFGFLWARLYLMRWFREVDQSALEKKVSQLEMRQLADAKALALVNQQLNRTPDDVEATEQEFEAIIRATSQPVKTQIFSQAEKASESFGAEHYDLRIQTAISLFKALTASDLKERDHKVRAELSYALSRQKPPDVKAAEDQLSKAIQIRDKLRLSGWKYYEMRRARYQIIEDPEFKGGRPSETPAVEKILSDLRAARSERDKWEGWLDREPGVRQWLELNKIDIATLDSKV